MASRKTQEKLAESRKAREAQEAKSVPDENVEATDADVYDFEKQVAEAAAAAQKAAEERAAREKEYFALYRRQTEALERIAAALEARVGPQGTSMPPPLVEVVRKGSLPPAAMPDTPEGDVKPPKKVDLKAAQQAFLDAMAQDREHAVRVLKGFGVERVSSLPQEKYADFVAKLA